jgi:hypothetical protein
MMYPPSEVCWTLEAALNSPEPNRMFCVQETFRENASPDRTGREECEVRAPGIRNRRLRPRSEMQ